MGGRGQNYTIQKRLKNFKNAVIARNKLKNYILKPTKDEDKARFFKSLKQKKRRLYDKNKYTAFRGKRR